MSKVVFIDLPGCKPLPAMSALAAAAGSMDFTSVTSEGAALRLLNSIESPAAIVTNSPMPEILELCRELHPASRTVLVTELPMKTYSSQLRGNEHILLDHIVVNKITTDWTVQELRVTLQKILRNDIFGLEKYLATGTHIREETITNSGSRDYHNSQVMELAKGYNLGQHTAKMIFGITEELLMNAIYDAPVAGGRHHYNALPRTTVIELQPDEYATLRYGCDGFIFGISICDPFGALKREKLFEYIKKVLMRRDSTNLIDNKKGGAGLGLFKILYSSHSLVCNVEPKARTEIMALIDIRDQLRDFSKAARSIHYFEVA